MIIEEVDAISECNNLLLRGIVVGASSGAVVHAIQNYIGYSADLELKKIVGIFPDRGERYLDTIYDKQWCDKVDIDTGDLRGDSANKTVLK